MRRVREAEALFIQYRGLAVWIGVKLARKFRQSVSEVVEEAESALAILLMEKWGMFNPKKGSATTWIYHQLYWHLFSYCEERAQEDDDYVSLDGFDVGEPRGRLEVMWSELGNEGRMLLRVVFEAPGVLGGELWGWKRDGSVKLRVHAEGRINEKKRAAVVRYLKRGAGWPREQIVEAFKQVEECARER